MGQRLNIEIWEDGKVLANSYFHWDAYTSTAIQHTKKILEKIDECKAIVNPVLRAIRLLEVTGAGLTDDEKEIARTEMGLTAEKFAECSGRNRGLIAISNGGVANFRGWEEGRVSIFLDENRIDFDVLTYLGYGDWRDEYEGDYGPIYNLPFLGVSPRDIKFKDFNEFAEMMRCPPHFFRFETDRSTPVAVIE